jgi:hypothetical protein
MPLPWQGGWWRLSDIIKYEVTSTMSLIKTASIHKRDILKFRNKMCCDAVKKGKTQAPYFYIFPLHQHDQSELVNTVNLLREHNIRVSQLDQDITIDNRNYKKGDIVISLAQPFRPFIKEVLEKQIFPVRHYTPGGKIIKPYDITSWSLPLHRSLNVKAISDPASKQIITLLHDINTEFSLRKPVPKRYNAAVFTANNNESYRAAFWAMKNKLKVQRLKNPLNSSQAQAPAGSFVILNNTRAIKKLNQFIKTLAVSPVFLKGGKVKANPVKMPRIALVETYYHDMDAGWTRFIFDTYDITYTVIRPGEFTKTNFAKKYDIVVFPNVKKSLLMTGKRESDGKKSLTSYPPEYTKGIGKEGMERLMTFLDKGGRIISWGSSTELFTGILKIKHSKDNEEEFQLPFKDISKKLSSSGLYCPGSLLRISLLKDHPLTLGLPHEIGIFTRGHPVFATEFPRFDMDRRVIAKYAKENVLMSGYCENPDKIANQSCMVWLKKGKGQLILFGFNPQFRASTQASFKLLFNALLY